MANINVKDVRVSGGGTQTVGSAFTVTVIPNNRELAAAAPGSLLATASACTVDAQAGIYGHRCDVEVEIVGSGGVKAFGSEVGVCAPAEGTASDPRVSFDFELQDPGAYDVQATVIPHEKHSPDSEVRSIEVVGTGEADEPSSGSPDDPRDDTDDSAGGGGIDLDRDGDGTPDGAGLQWLLTNPLKALVGLVVLYVVLSKGTETAVEQATGG